MISISNRSRSRLVASALSVALGASAAAVVATTTTPASAAVGVAPSAPSAPSRLTVEDQAHPLNIEGSPRFGWLPKDTDGNEVQSAYEVEVRDAGGAMVWDSEKVTSSQQSYVDYAGAALDPGASYDWTVRTWDRDDQVSPWATATFETGLGDGDWDGAQWIRRQPGGLTAPMQITDGRARLTAAGIVLAKTTGTLGDYTLDVDITPRTSSSAVIFRAPDARSGYMWALVPGTGVRHHVQVDGAFPSGDRVTFPATIAIGTTYHLTITVTGSTITGFLDGQQIGTVTNTRWATGTIGLRNVAGEVGDYDNVKVTAADGSVLFADDFSGDLAKWTVGGIQEPDEWTFARKEVALPGGEITRARSYFAADDTYELWVNGQRADRSTNLGYQGEGYYQAADITDLVKPGRTTVFSTVSRWSGSGQGRAAGTPGLLGRVVVEYADGSVVTVNTDGTWRTRPGDHVAVGTRNGEGLYVTHQNAVLTAAAGAWKLAGYDDSAWTAPIVIGVHPVAPFTHLAGRQTRMTETVVHPERILTATDGTPVADFGTVIPARPGVHFESGVAGRTISVRGSYLLDDTGRASTSKIATQGTDMRFLYTQVDGVQDFAAFDHLGFRYLEIPGSGEDISVDDVTATVLHATMPSDGDASSKATFTSSSGTLDGVWGLMQRSLLYSVQDSFVDTPTREQGQFLADSANISYGLMATQGERVATRQAMREFLLSQTRYWSSSPADTGRYNAVYPNGDGKRDIPDFTELVPDWVWRYYLETGDRDLLAQAYPAIAATAGYIRRHIPTTGGTAGLVTQLTGGSGQYLYGIVDWPASGRFDYDMSATARTTVNALGVNVLRTAALMAAELDEPAADVQDYTADADNLATTMNATLRRPDGTYVDGLSATGTQSAHAGQHASSYAVAFGIAPEADRPALADSIAAMGMKQGPMTSHWLLKALADGDAEDGLLKMLTDHTDLGWAKVLADGGTFTPESWVQDSSANSLSHGWGSQAIVDIQEDVLGIELTGAGASEVSLRIPDTGLTHAAGSRPTQRGAVTSDWTRDGDRVTLAATVPVNVSAVVELPAAGAPYDVVAPGGATALLLDELLDGSVGVVRYRVGSGSWTFGTHVDAPPTSTTPPATNPPPVVLAPTVTRLVAKGRKHVARTSRRITMTATVSPQAAGGMVAFVDRGDTLKLVRVDASGKATMRLPRDLGVGRHRITAAYFGNAATLGSTSPAVKVRVVRR